MGFSFYIEEKPFLNKFSRRVLGIQIGGSIVVSGLLSSVMNIILVARTYYIHKQQMFYSVNVGLFFLKILKSSVL